MFLQHHGDGLRGVEGWVALASALGVSDERLLELIGEAEVIHRQAAGLVAEDAGSAAFRILAETMAWVRRLEDERR